MIAFSRLIIENMRENKILKRFKRWDSSIHEPLVYQCHRNIIYKENYMTTAKNSIGIVKSSGSKFESNFREVEEAFTYDNTSAPSSPCWYPIKRIECDSRLGMGMSPNLHRYACAAEPSPRIARNRQSPPLLNCSLGRGRSNNYVARQSHTR